MSDRVVDEYLLPTATYILLARCVPRLADIPAGRTVTAAETPMLEVDRRHVAPWRRRAEQEVIRLPLQRLQRPTIWNAKIDRARHLTRFRRRQSEKLIRGSDAPTRGFKLLALRFPHTPAP